MTRITVILASAVFALSLATPADAGAPLRSGAVVGGPIDTAPGTVCEIAADCLIWLASGCSPHLAGLDPAVQTSIVDVRKLAGRRTTRRFVVRPGSVEGVEAGVVIGGFRIQFWSSSCKEVQPDRPVLDSYTPYFPRQIRNESRFKIPARAAWMTAAADDNVHIRWDMW